MSYKMIANLCGMVMIVMLVLLVNTQNELQNTREKLYTIEKDMVKRNNTNVKKSKSVESIPYKNKNLLNIKSLKNDKWKGQIGVDKHGHAIFKDWEYGIRAASYVLKNYSKKHKVDTIEDLVHRFCTGNHEAYIKFLSEKLNVNRNQKIELIKYIPKLLKYMAIFESGDHKLPDKLFASYDVIADL